MLVAAASLVRAQAPDPSFDELARRAQEAVDSKPAEAVALFRQALALRPSWADGWLYLGAELYQLNRYREARDAFRNGIPLAPGNGTAWGFLGLCEYELGDSDGALADIRKGEALGLGGNREFQTAVRVRGALILIHAKAFDVAAVEQLRPLLMDFQADSPAVIEALGLCALAIPRLPSELPASKRPVVDLAGKALWANMSKRSAEAESAFRELLEKYPQEPGVHYAHGVYLMDYDQRAALAEFQKELEVDPTQWPSLLFSIMLELKRGQPETAIQLIERAARLVPEGQRWVCHAQMGNALLALGRFEKAIPELETAVRLQPSNSSLHFSLQKAYRLAGRQAEAEREGTEFLRLKAQEDPLSLPGRAGGSTGAVR